MNLSQWFTAASLACFTLGFCPTSYAVSFLGLGDLPDGITRSTASSVSADGQTVVGFGQSASGTEAYVWTAAAGMQGIGDLPGSLFESWARGVSADGTVVVGLGFSENGDAAFRWTSSGGMKNLGALPGGISSGSWGVSDDGNVVVGDAASAAGFEAFRWTQTTGIQSLGDLPGGILKSWSTGVSADGGVVVGESQSAQGREAFLWTEVGGMQGLGDLAGGIFESGARAVSGDGSTVVGFGESSRGHEAFIWTASGGMLGLGDLPGGSSSGSSPFFSTALAVSSNGSVVVGTGFSDIGDEAFIWTERDGMQSVRDILEGLGLGQQLEGWELIDAADISADGNTIVGFGINPNGQGEAWVAVIPEPSTLVIGVFFAPALFRKRRRLGVSLV